MHSKDDRTCYLCIRLHNDYQKQNYLQEHHVVFGTSNRKLSEKFGLKVYLCDAHHEHSKEAVHVNTEIRKMLCEDAQREFEKKYPELSFLKVFGKNYINSPGGSSHKSNEKGFIPIEGLSDDEKSINSMF